MFYPVTKRAFDILITLLLSPVWVTLTLAGCMIVLIASPGNPLFASRRVGLHARMITIYKIRTMVKNSEKTSAGVTALNDPRIIPLGRSLRLTKIDEMPQFWSVLKGDLSIVGPRPELEEYVAQYTDKEHDKILSVKPGMVDFGTLAFPDLQSVLGEDPSKKSVLEFFAREKIRLRLEYVEKRGLWTDFKILMATPWSVIKSVLQNG